MIDEIHKTPDGKYLVKFVPVNRFFTNEHLETKPILFLDFDGTISCRDAIDAILERFADQSWEIIEERWKNGAIGSRQCLREQVALINASPKEINDLLDEIKIDEYQFLFFNLE